MKIKFYFIQITLLFALISSNIFGQSLPTPGLTAPTNSSTNNSPNELLDWSASTGQTAYQYRYGLTSNLSGAPVFSVTSSQANTVNLNFGATYYWQVRAVKTTAPIDSSNWSTVWTFSTIDQIGLLAPANGAINQSPNEILDWSALSGLTFYDYQWDTTSLFNSPLLTSSSISSGTSQVTTSNLRFGTTYFWRVRGRHATDTSSWSSVRFFSTIDQIGLLAPANGATNQAPNEILDWSALSGLTFYDYQWDTTALFNSPLLISSSISSGTSQVTTSNLRFGTVYYWRVRGRHTADTSLWSVIRSFSTIDQFSLLAPANGATNQAPNEILDWSPLSGITFYDYQWDTTALFNSPLLVSASIASGSSQITSSNLRFGTVYYWRARARHETDTTQWTEVRFFTTIDQFSLVAPTNGATNQAPNEILDWSPLSGITFYDYQWDTTSSFNSPLLTSSSIASGTSQITSSNLRFGTVYYWRARARHAVDTMQWSEIRSFTTVDQIFLVSPLNAATNVNTNPLLDWSALTGILNYQYQLDTLFNFSTGITQTVAGGTSQASTSGLLNGRVYYWRVRAWHATDTTNWSSIRSFGVGLASVVAPLFTQVGPYCSGESIAALPSTSLNGVSGSWSPAINNTQTTTYTFTPNASQSATFTTLTIAIKQPSSAVDVKSACTSYQWINGITYSQSTNTPTFTLTNAVGCDSTITLNLTISTVGIDVQPISETTVENSEVFFTVNSTSPTANFQWQINSGSGFSNIANGGQFSGATSNTLTVSGITLTNNNQQFRCIVSSGTCSSTSDIATLTVEGIVGLNGSEANTTVVAYPNPVNDILYLSSTENQHGATYKVFDHAGRSVLSGVISGKLQPIEMIELPSGLYFIVLENQSFKVIKQ